VSADDRWTLRAADRALLGNKTGATRLGFAVLLKLFAMEGRFPRHAEDVPLAAVEAIAGQVGVSAAAWQGYDWRGRTIEYHRARVRAVLGFREATLDDAEALGRWLEGQVLALERYSSCNLGYWRRTRAFAQQFTYIDSRTLFSRSSARRAAGRSIRRSFMAARLVSSPIGRPNSRPQG